MTGPELNARLRQLKPELPVLFMTGYAEPTSIPINILEKPFRMDELRANSPDPVQRRQLNRLAEAAKEVQMRTLFVKWVLVSF